MGGSAISSLVFALGCQVLVFLPVYFFAPFALFVLLASTAVYCVLSRSWTLLAVTSWWLLTTPYWSIIHFLTFPALFALSLGAQVFLFVAAAFTVYLYPTLPDDAARYYNAVMDQRRQHSRSHAKETPGEHPMRGESHHHSKVRDLTAVKDEYPIKEESKSL